MKTFGYIKPKDNKQQSIAGGLQYAPLPKRLYFNPKNTKLLVKTGDTVLKGQLLAYTQGDLRTETIVAPTSGIITSTTQQYPIMHNSDSNLNLVNQIVLEIDNQDKWRQRNFIDIDNLDFQSLVAIVHKAGIVGMGGAGFSSAFKLNISVRVSKIIVNAAECEPYITADQSMLEHFAAEVIKGAELLHKVIITQPKIIIAIEDNMPQAIKSLKQILKQRDDYLFELKVIPTKYPSGSEKQLIQILTGKVLPKAKFPADIGMVIFNAATIRAIWRAVALDQPVLDRVVTIAGKALNKNANFITAIGTPISELLKICGFYQLVKNRVIAGGALMGHTMKSIMTPLLKTTNCIIAPSFAEMPLPKPEQNCIKCGDCADVCPANLQPQQLYWLARGQDYDKLEANNLFDCIECGACSFVCPSNIPLVQYYRHSKGTIRQNQIEKVVADRARLRFEQRKQRLQQIEAERIAKREQRMAELKKNAANRDATTADSVGRAERQKQSLLQQISSLELDLNTTDLADSQRLQLEAKLKNCQVRLNRINN